MKSISEYCTYELAMEKRIPHQHQSKVVLLYVLGTICITWKGALAPSGNWLGDFGLLFTCGAMIFSLRDMVSRRKKRAELEQNRTPA